MNIAYFAPGSYDGLKQRPQHIAELLAINNEVIYIEPTISCMRFLLKGGEKFKGNKTIINKNFLVKRLNGLLTVHKSLEYFDILGINSISEKLQLKEIISNCDIIWIGYSGWYNVIKHIKNKCIVFDKMDDDFDITRNYLMKKLLIKVEPKLIKKSNIIFVSCQQFMDRIQELRSNTYLIRNGVSLSFGNQQIETNINNIASRSEKIYGYIGTVGHWFDKKAIEIILEQNSKNKVVIVGDNAIEKIIHERVTYIDRVEKKLLPQIINTFDICLYPFKINNFLETINPVKIYEYLALNKPVIAVESIETKVFGDKCYLYGNYVELKNICNMELTRPFLNDTELKEFIDENCWEKRVNEILNVLNEWKRKSEK